MKFAVVIPAYNVAPTLAATIQAWRAATPASIVVIDDGSSDNSADIASRAGANVIRLAQNSGRGAARARGMQETGTPYVLMCDAALKPEGDFISPALSWLEEARVAAVFAHIVQPEGRTVVERWRGRHLFKSQPVALNRRALLATGLCMLRREAIQETGGFDPTLRSGEDAHLGHRLLGAGWDVVADPALRAECFSRDTANSVLARYARWNSPRGLRGRRWLRQLAYAMRTMVREDLRARDPLAAFLSLAVPFYQLRRR